MSIVDSWGIELVSATVNTRNLEAAEETAIALATTTCLDAAVIFTDLQVAMQNYTKGRVSAQALEISKRQSTLMPYNCVTWVPGHKELEATRQHMPRPAPTRLPLSKCQACVHGGTVHTPHHLLCDTSSKAGTQRVPTTTIKAQQRGQNRTEKI